MHKKIYMIITGLFLMSFLLLSVPVQAEKATDTAIVENMQETIDAIQAIQPDEVPDFDDDSEINREDLFDISDYFDVFTHLSMEDGYTLDYFIVGDDFFGSCPLTYVRETDSDPITTYEEYEQEAEAQYDLNNMYNLIGFVMGEDPNVFEDKIHIDGTPEGYVEYVLLQVMGAQFYLTWHALYNDAIPVCDNAAFEPVLTEALGYFSMGSEESHEDLAPKAEIMAKGKFVDFRPLVEFKDDTVDVTIMTFTKWGGLIKTTYTIERYYPHSIVNVFSQTLIDYQCGAMF